MMSCRVCGTVTDDFPYAGGCTLKTCRACYNAQRRRRYAERKADTNEKRRADYAANVNGIRDKHRAAMALRYSERGAAVREWWNQLPVERKRELYRIKQARYRAVLTDCYVRRLLLHPGRTTLKSVPYAMVQAKKIQIRIERYCNEKR